MSDVITVSNWINDAIFVSLVNTALQMTVFIPLITLSIWIFRIKSATIRHSLWLFALFAMVALPLLTPFIPRIDFSGFHHQRRAGYGLDDMMELGMGAGDAGELSEASASMPSTSAAKAALNREIDVSLINPVSIAYFTWCAGALFVFCVTIGVYVKLRKLRLRSSDIESQAALEVLSRLRDRLDISRAVALKASSEIYIPMSMGIFSPVIIVPDSVMNGESSHELEMILAHELAHIKRCDYLIRLLQNLLGVVFFFHPLFHLIKRNLAREREHICDDWVIDVTRRRSEYAECLVGLLERAIYGPVNIPVTLAMAERKRDIPGRVDMIVDRTRKTATKVSRRALTVIFLIGVLSLPIIGGLELARFAGARPASNEGWIVFARQDSGIWIMDADGKNEKQITDIEAGNPVCSPDGQRIAFSGFFGIYVMNADGSNMKQITNGRYDDFPTWSPDGQQIAFTRAVIEHKDGKLEVENEAIYEMSSDGANLKKLTDGQPFFDRWPSWSPDGRKIAFQQWGYFPVGEQICIIDANGDNREVVYEKGECPVWSPDGKRIAFAAISIEDDTLDIYVMDADGLNVRELDHREGWYEDYPTWSPDGTKIAFSSYPSPRWDERDIYVMDADGSNIQQLTKTKENEYAPDWTVFPYAVEPAGKLKSTWGKIKALMRSR